MTAVEQSLVRQLRSRLGDERATVPAFSLSVTGAESALLDLSSGVFNVECVGGRAQSVRLPFVNPDYSTVGGLVAYLSTIEGYVVKASEDMVTDHSSHDLHAESGLVQVAKGKTTIIRHRMYSDDSLLSFIRNAAAAHNVNYSNGRVPPGEQHYVLTRALGLVYRAQAAEMAKRSNGAENAKILLGLASDADAQYRDDVARNSRVIPRAQIDESRIGTGDIVVGTVTRIDPRTGMELPARAAQPSDVPVLLDPPVGDVEDIQVRISWRQNKELNFARFELWRDTRSQVERGLSGADSNSQGISVQDSYNKASTSVQVAGGAGDTLSFYFGTRADFALASGASRNCFVDGIPPNALEPETTYWYRLFAMTVNGEVLGSNSVRVTTLSMRALAARGPNGSLTGDWLSTFRGPISGGTAVTLKGTNFGTGTTVQLNGKAVDGLNIVSPTEITFNTPAFFNPALVGKQLSLDIISANGLIDRLQNVWTVDP